jgi:hypothetical protein
LIEERKAAKQRMLTGSTEEKALAAASHKEKHRAVRKSIRKDKRNYTESLACEAQDTAEREVTDEE